MKTKIAMAVLGVVIAAGVATSAAASGPGGGCQLKSVAEIVTDLFNGGSFRPLECYY